MGDIKANYSQADLYKAIRGLATYSWSILDLYLQRIDSQNEFMGRGLAVRGGMDSMEIRQISAQQS